MKKILNFFLVSILALSVFLVSSEAVWTMGSGTGGSSEEQPSSQQSGQTSGGQGISSCENDGQCPEGYKCENKACVAGARLQDSGGQSLEGSGSCTDTNGCNTGEVCVNNVCVSSGSGSGANVSNSNLRQYATQLNKLKVNNPQALVGVIIRGLMGVLGTIALVMMLYAGIIYMTARGNSEATMKARDTILWAGLGIVVIFASYALVDFIFEIFR